MDDLLHLPLLDIALGFVVTFGLLAALAWLSPRVGLVDRPDQRKHHEGEVPLVGGLAIFVALVLFVAMHVELDARWAAFLLGGGLLVAVGVADDMAGLAVWWRIACEVLAAAVMIWGAGLWVGNLGDLLGMGAVMLPTWIGYPFTVIAVFGIINAFNMIDGIDGLAAGVFTAAVATLFFLTDAPTLDAIGLFLLGGLGAFLLANTGNGRPVPKIFLGDAGSKLLGFVLVWMLIEVSRAGGGAAKAIDPATALYLVGLPLIDMVTTTLRRVRKGQSPFRADRSHLHHVLQHAGMSPRAAMWTIVSLALAVNLLGVLLARAEAPEWFQFGLFVALFIGHFFVIEHAWRLGSAVKAQGQARPDWQREER